MVVALQCQDSLKNLQRSANPSWISGVTIGGRAGRKYRTEDGTGKCQGGRDRDKGEVECGWECGKEKNQIGKGGKGKVPPPKKNKITCWIRLSQQRI